MLLLVGLAIIGSAKWNTFAGERSLGSTPVAANPIEREKELPVGFKIERYTRLWERNPFTVPSKAAPQVRASAFDNLFLTCWLNDGGQEVVYVENSQTNEVQRITSKPNQNNLRLLGMHLNSNPRLVEAAIAAGQEQGTVKFRFDLQGTPGLPNPAVAQIPTNSLGGQVGEPTVANPPMSANLSNGLQPAGSPPAQQVIGSRIYPGIPRVHIEGGATQASRLQGLQRKQALVSPVRDPSNASQN